jgi:hypothetical protein
MPFAAAALRLVLLAASGYGLYLNTGLSNGALDLETFNYFTILSNALVFIVFAVLTVRTFAQVGRPRPITPVLPPVLSGLVLVAISITGIVYNFVLVPRNVSLGTYDGGDLADTLVHTVAPLLVLADWLFFAPKGRFRWWFAFVWLVVPAAYAVFALIRAELGPVLTSVGSRYPYFFLDVDEFGWNAVFLNIGGLFVAFLAIGFVFVALDWALGRAMHAIGRRGRNSSRMRR